jgi:hypothetical protein
VIASQIRAAALYLSSSDNSRMGDTQMTFTSGRRALATMLVTGVATLGVTGAAQADTAAPPAKPTTSQHAGFLGGGLFKTLFGVFGAVREQTPTIAAPIIADAVTAKKITQAQADELTALLSGKLAKPAATATAKEGDGSHHAAVKLAPEQLAVLSDVMQAVAKKLPEIAKPVVDAAVAAGDITQKQADLITKVIGMFASFKPGHLGMKPAAGAGAATTAKAPIAALEKQVTKKVRKAARKASKRSHKTRRAAR